MRERWGTFSVRDHVTAAPFVSDVLIYDRLVIPIPDPNNPESERSWADRGYRPDDQRRCLDILGVKTDWKDGLALTVPWDSSKEERFRTRMNAAAALTAQKNSPKATYYMDPFAMTRELNAGEFRPALPADVTKAWAVAAYPSAAAFREDLAASHRMAGIAPGEDRRSQLAFELRHRFLTPERPDPDHEMLKRAADLSRKDDFRRKRALFYAWQENIIENEIDDEKAIRELEQLLDDYNKATQKAFGEVIAKAVFTTLAIGVGIGGAAVAGGLAGLAAAGGAGLIEFGRFWAFDRKPKIDDGDLNAAAMIHDAEKTLSLN
jgi:hypothetical protein